MSEEKRNRKCTTASYSLELRLLTSKEDEDILNKRFRVASHIQNVMIKEAIRRIGNLLRDHEYKELIFKIRIRNKWTKEEKKALQVFYNKYGLSEYSFHKYVDSGQKQYKKNIDCHTRQKEASKVWKATKDFLFGKGEAIHMKSYRKKKSVEGKSNVSGIRYRDEHVDWMGLHMPVRIKDKDIYAKQCLKDARIKYCRIKRKWHKHKWRYYVDLVMEGIPPLKRREIGKGRTGIDIGTSTIAAMSEANILFKELNDGIAPIDKEIKRLNRKADRQRRACNPENYNADGTIKRNSKTFHRRWHISRNLKETYDRIRELYQKRANKLNQFQNVLANQIVSMGDEIVVETMSFKGLQKKSRKTEKSEKTGRYKKKKRFGRSIQIHAPASLIAKVKIKMAYQGGKVIEVKTGKLKASQYNHITGEYMSSALNRRWKELIPGISVQRDLYSAFLLFNIKDEETIDDELCEQTFDNFYDSHNRLIEELRKEKQEGKHFPSCMGI